MRAWLLGPTLAVVLLIALTSMAAGATLVVDRTDDDPSAIACDDATPNDCSLRGAITKANGLGEASAITVPAGTYVLGASHTCSFQFTPVPSNVVVFSTTSLCLNNNVTLVGAGAATTIIDGNRPSIDLGVSAPVMFVSTGRAVELRGLTLTRGNFSGSSLIGHGGGIRNGGILTLSDSVVSASFAGATGGGIYNTGSLTLNRSAVTGNASGQDGAGIWNADGGTVTVTDSVISGNEAMAGGGGLFNFLGTVTMVNTTVSGNTAHQAGGGITNHSFNTMTLTNVTVSGNRGRTSGGIDNSSTLHLRNVTITGNTARFFEDPSRGIAGGLRNLDNSTLTLQNTLIAGNIAAENFAPDCLAFAGRLAGLQSQGYNLIQNLDGCDITGVTTGNVHGQDPKLGPLQDNGGFMPTHALLAGSPAIEAGNPAVPGSGGVACTAVDQRGNARPQGPRCDIGAYETAGERSLLVVPDRGGNGGSVLASIYGLDVAEGSGVTLTRAGQSDVVGNPVIPVDALGVGTSFELAGKATGAWDVVVSQPGGATRTIPGGFTVEAAREADLWADVLVRAVVRVARRASFTVIYGNRGNVDARAVPLVLSLPGAIGLTLGFQVASPPSQPGQVSVDWTLVPAISQIDGRTYVPLLISVVPAGFTGTLEIGVTAPLAQLGIPFTTSVEIGPSMFDSGGIARHVESARSYANGVLGVQIPSTVVPQMEAYVTTALQSAVEAGRRTLLSGAGTAAVNVYSTSQLVIDAANFGVARTQGAAALSTPRAASAWVASLTRKLRSLLTRASSTALGWIAMLLRPAEAYAESPGDCAEKGMQYNPAKGTCVPDGCQFSAGKKCGGGGAPTRPSGSHDPNEKTGVTGGGEAHHIRGTNTLTYAIFFENLETAGLAAQEVVITDQLNPATMDLDTVSLGAIAFGATLVSPPAGLSQYSTTVDLRPARDLIVAITAALDRATGLLTWRFVALDPLTLQLPDDPSAGFLPPNVNPPEGDGSVVFSVKPKAGLASGIQIQNTARIVFDVNPPIDTPAWINTIDDTKPTSQVTSAAPVAGALNVQWTGNDGGAGIRDFTIFVSENGGTFTPWLPDTTATSGTFPATCGKTYGFYSVASDLAGNVETAPAQADRTATFICGTRDMAVTQINAPTTVTLTTKQPQQTIRVGVQIQNRGAQPETIANLATLDALVTLQMPSLGVCATPVPVLASAARQKSLPRTLKAKQKLDVVFEVTLGCANDRGKGVGHEDYRLIATVHAPGGDAHPDDDVCPRSVTPPFVVDPFPDGSIKDKGCGEKKPDKTLGADVPVDVVVKP